MTPVWLVVSAGLRARWRTWLVLAVPGQLTATGLARAALIGAVGAALAVATAVAVSPVFPVGLAGIAEPHPGVDADWMALLLGAGGVLAATVAVAGLALAAVVASVPGISASRIRPADALRAE